ncbi:uncharacterized protein EV420DRAFT_1748937 [Desarmillaria tabescens]|uniref:Uncharacterized protein n=1 Tax=Armillaria tabescens TaxID=1929756 RepID=A0AA39N4K7_ARMTA|nr:uncharacterized protein EV420DRAFT_1748937 [Desarmillaria tabescens]KAK0457040.1 hypothetical protein EV420DRAFT_1748937 [Desarmillaria tabescens]
MSITPKDSDEETFDYYRRPKVTSLPPKNSSIVVIGAMMTHCPDYDLLGVDKTYFQIIRNRHEVTILGPPLLDDDGRTLQLELIETLLHTVPFDEINQATLYITGDGRARLIPQVFTIYPSLPFISGVRCVEDIELQVTSWLYIGWKLALLDGIPVEVDYAYNLMTSLCIENRLEAMRQLLPLDLTTPLQAHLVSDGSIYGLVNKIEEDSRSVTYVDRNLVYSAFAKLQKHHIYFTDANEYELDDIAIVGDKVRFIRTFTGNWLNAAFTYDPKIHDQETLADARKSHWRVAEKLFDKLISRTESPEIWASPDFSSRVEDGYCVLNIVFAPEKPLGILAFMASTMSSGNDVTSLSKKKRRKALSSHAATTSHSAAKHCHSMSTSDELFQSSISEKVMESSATSDKPLVLSKRSSTRRSVFPYGNLDIDTPAVLPYPTRLSGTSFLGSHSLIQSVIPLPPDDSDDVAAIQSGHGWLEEVP